MQYYCDGSKERETVRGWILVRAEERRHRDPCSRQTTIILSDELFIHLLFRAQLAAVDLLAFIASWRPTTALLRPPMRPLWPADPFAVLRSALQRQPVTATNLPL